MKQTLQKVLIYKQFGILRLTFSIRSLPIGGSTFHISSHASSCFFLLGWLASLKHAHNTIGSSLAITAEKIFCQHESVYSQYAETEPAKFPAIKRMQ